MKVYVIEKGEYSDRHVIGVTLDEEKAKYVVEEGNNRASKNFWWASNDFGYTEFEMDKFDELYNLYKNNYKLFRINKELTTKTITITEAELGDYYLDEVGIVKKTYLNSLYVYVLANNEEKSLKIASDKFAEYEYENME